MTIAKMESGDCRAALAKAGFGRLACAKNNQPYVVPIYFAVEDELIYSFTLPGQKLDWMRQNPRVCLETDSVSSSSQWTSVVVLGMFRELTEAAEHREERIRALELLQKRPMWWEPGAEPAEGYDPTRGYTAILFRIEIDRISGLRRGSVPEPKRISSLPPFHARTR